MLSTFSHPKRRRANLSISKLAKLSNEILTHTMLCAILDLSHSFQEDVMRKLKDLLLNLGGAGIVLFYIVLSVIVVLPIFYIDVPLLLAFVFIVLAYMLPFSNAVFWIWGLVEVICNYSGFWAILYYVLFAILWIPSLISDISSLLSNLLQKKK